jgi:hypothetical protein
MTDPITNAVSLPAGSFDATSLQKGLEKAATGKPEKYDDAVRDAVSAAAVDFPAEQDSRTIPGYEFVEVEHKDLGVKETIQVYNGKLDDADAQNDAEKATETTNRQARATADAVDKADSPTKE